ncbi:MAG TPA: aldo/keto reductase [Candidatus Borkfalkia avicola]|uniref:Aldo/keto reductase n=1 Tax=Candidatus Borkfalkia avicola TaxID=2838503 RepID=A0A9D2D5W5_9FIRM|nr:aldo/keto reductase [Candidatus Borkfalkia avicola]
MLYRELGNTGLKVSEIGLGCEGFLGKDERECDRMFSLAFERGVNCMDLYSPNPELHKAVGRAAAAHGVHLILQAHLCTVWKNGQYMATRNLAEVKTSFEKMMQNLGTERVDIGMIHYVDSEETWNKVISDGILDYAKQLKREGRIGHIGMSSHNPLVALKAVESGEIEVLMFSVNPCYDLLPGDEDVNKLFEENSYSKPLFNIDPVREKLYETCQRRGVGITVMKVFGGGDLLTDDSPAGKALTVPQCIHYALTRPAVSAVFAGAHTEAELAASLRYEEADEEERDYAAVFATFPKISWQGHCMYCGHCAPCPKGIEVASVTKFLNLAKAQKAVPETVREHYNALRAHAGDCIACGACEKRCPFGVRIIENMKAARAVFGK